MGEVFWLWVVLVYVPVRSVETLRERRPDDERPAVKTHTLGVARFPGREASGSFGIARVSVHPHESAMVLRYNAALRGNRPRFQQATARCDRHITIPIGDHTVIAQAFTNEGDARAWAKDRHNKPLP